MPDADHLFQIRDESTAEYLSKDMATAFHRTTVQLLFMSAQARRDVQTSVAFLCSRVKTPDLDDWGKLKRVLKYLNGTTGDKLTISAGSEKAIECLDWFVDVAFAAHPDMKGHTGMAIKSHGGTGAPLAGSLKQKLNTSSSTTCELVAVEQILLVLLWMPLIMKEQGIEVCSNVLHQDNKSAVLVEENGKHSSGKRTCALDIQYFMVTDQVEHGNLSITYYPTDDMVGDFMSKGLIGAKFLKF